MLKLLKEIISSLLLLLLMVSFMFILLRLAPGDPSLKFVSPELSPQLKQSISERFGIDKPITAQYLLYIKNVFSGDLGISYTYRLSVIKVIMQYLPYTIILGLLTFIIQILLSLWLSYKTWFAKKWFGSLLDHSSIIIYSIPSFVTGLLLVFVFSEKLKWLPSSGIASLDNDSMPLGEQLWDYFKHLILPLVTISAGGTALFYRYIRDNIKEIKNKPFVTNLYTYGLSEKEVLKKHVIPNALNPVISVAGVELGILLSGLLITEVMFSLPGLGRLTLEAVLSRDYPLICGCTLITGIIIILTNFAADVLKSKLDKRYIAGESI